MTECMLTFGSEASCAKDIVGRQCAGTAARHSSSSSSNSRIDFNKSASDFFRELTEYNALCARDLITLSLKSNGNIGSMLVDSSLSGSVKARSMYPGGRVKSQCSSAIVGGWPDERGVIIEVRC